MLGLPADCRTRPAGELGTALVTSGPPDRASQRPAGPSRHLPLHGARGQRHTCERTQGLSVLQRVWSGPAAWNWTRSRRGPATPRAFHGLAAGSRVAARLARGAARRFANRRRRASVDSHAARVGPGSTTTPPERVGIWYRFSSDLVADDGCRRAISTRSTEGAVSVPPGGSLPLRYVQSFDAAYGSGFGAAPSHFRGDLQRRRRGLPLCSPRGRPSRDACAAVWE